MGQVIQFQGGTISWKTQLQKTVSLSTAEAEYVAISDACKETMALQQLLQEIGIISYNPGPIQVLTDNQAALSMTTSSSSTSRTRHISVRYHFVRDLYTQGAVNVEYIRSSNQLADLFTKPLPAPAFNILAPQVLRYEDNNKNNLRDKQHDGQSRQSYSAVWTL